VTRFIFKIMILIFFFVGELRCDGVLGRWDEKADPLRSTLWVCKG
jgi:hypothetical protein